MEYPRFSEEPPQFRSSFVTVIAVISIFISIFQFYGAYSNLAMMDSVSAVSGLGVTTEVMESLMPSPASLYSEMFLSFLMVVASVLLFKRMNAGRMMYLVVLTAGSFWTVYSSVRSYALMSQYLDLPGVQETSMTLIGATTAVTIGINIYLVWKLTRDDVKSEFV
jgi:hypothetical protein